MAKPSVFSRTSLALGVLLAVTCIEGAALAQSSLLGSGAYRNGVLTVVGPNGFAVTLYSKHGTPGLSSLGNLPDGEYSYQLSATTNQAERLLTPRNDGRASLTSAVRKSVATSGTFRVAGGVIAVAAAASSNDSDDQD